MGQEAAGPARLVRHLGSLLEVSKALGAAIDLDSLLAIIRSRVTDVMEAERGSIFVHEESSGTLWNRTSEGLGRGELRVALGTGIVGHVARTGTPLNVPDAYDDPRFNPEIDSQTGFHTRSILCAPLFGHSGRLLGVIEVLNKAGGGAFTREDEALLEAFASHAAVALDRARLVEASLEKERIEEGLRLAHDVQMAMLPRRFPRSGSFELMAEVRPARQVGGDLYDFLVDGERLWFLIGDVSGKGMPAALFMAVVRTLFRAGAPSEPSPAALFTRLSSELARSNDDAMFVTAFAGCLDLASGTLAAASAGHPPPYRLSAGGAVERLAVPPGVPLGVCGGPEYRASTLVLHRGDGLFLYTDGITEAVDEQGQPFSVPRLEEYLRGASQSTAAEIVRGALAAVERLVGTSPPFDDIAVMALRYLGG